MFDNVGIAQDPLSGADFDAVGYSLFGPALTLAGVSGGSTLTVNGMRYTWPNAASGKPDNMIVDGQTLTITPYPGTTRIGFLGMANHGPSAGLVKLTYTVTDATGTHENEELRTLDFSDWTLNGGSGSPEPANLTAITMQLRASDPFVPSPTTTYVFATSLLLDPDLGTLTKITLPSSSDVSQGRIHLFSVTTG